MKRKIAAVVLCVLVCVFCLAACGGEPLAGSKYLGTWEGATAEYAGISMDVSTLYPEGFSFELTADGKIAMTLEGDVTKGKWEETDTGIVVDKGSSNEVVFTDADGELTLEQDGVTLHFLKAADESSDDGEETSA